MLLAGFPLALAVEVPVFALVLALLALALLGVSLARHWPAALPVVLIALGGEYLTTRPSHRPMIDGWALLYAAALFVLAEAVSWAFDTRWDSRSDPDITPRRVRRLAAVVGGAVALDLALMLLIAIPALRAVALPVAGAAAAAGVMALVAILAWRR